MATNTSDTIRLIAAIVTALCMVVLVPLMTWVLLATVSQGERIIALETWRGEGRRYTDVDAKKDFGVVLQLIAINESNIKDIREDIEGVLRP
jgi:hypothetical protein